MTITTSKGKVLDIEWAWAPVGMFKDMMLQFRDDRPLSEIVADFEGCEHFRRQSEEEGDMDFDGYTAVKSIVRPFYETDHAVVQLTMARSAKE